MVVIFFKNMEILQCCIKFQYEKLDMQSIKLLHIITMQRTDTNDYINSNQIILIRRLQRHLQHKAHPTGVLLKEGLRASSLICFERHCRELGGIEIIPHKLLNCIKVFGVGFGENLLQKVLSRILCGDGKDTNDSRSRFFVRRRSECEFEGAYLCT